MFYFVVCCLIVVAVWGVFVDCGSWYFGWIGFGDGLEMGFV